MLFSLLSYPRGTSISDRPTRVHLLLMNLLINGLSYKSINQVCLEVVSSGLLIKDLGLIGFVKYVLSGS